MAVMGTAAGLEGALYAGLAGGMLLYLTSSGGGQRGGTPLACKLRDLLAGASSSTAPAREDTQRSILACCLVKASASPEAASAASTACQFLAVDTRLTMTVAARAALRTSRGATPESWGG